MIRLPKWLLMALALAVFAGLTLLCVPCVIVFIFLQRRLMEGIGYRGVSR